MHKPSYTLQARLHTQTCIFKLQSIIAEQELNTRRPEVFIVKSFENLYCDLMVLMHEVTAKRNHLKQFLDNSRETFFRVHVTLPCHSDAWLLTLVGIKLALDVNVTPLVIMSSLGDLKHNLKLVKFVIHLYFVTFRGNTHSIHVFKLFVFVNVRT